MEQLNNTSGNGWKEASTEGLLLSLVSIAALTLSMINTSGILSALIWIAKFGGSIWLLYYFMKRYGAEHQGVSTFKHGFKTCLCSSLICSAYSFVLLRYLFPEKVTEIFDSTLSTISSMGASIPEQTTEMLLFVEDHYAQITSASTFFWCIIIGLIFCAILKNSTSSGNSVFTEDELGQNQE